MHAASIPLLEHFALPADLSAKALEVPGLQERLVRFIRLEVEMNEKRLKQHSKEAVELVKRARQRVSERAVETRDRTAAMQDFHANYTAMMSAL